MATHTTHYNLTKPAVGEPMNVGVLNDNADIIDSAMHGLQESIDSHGLLVLTGTVTMLPFTITNAAITENMVVVNSIIATEGAQTAEWTVTTSAGSLTITGASGALVGTTDITLYLMEQQQ